MLGKNSGGVTEEAVMKALSTVIEPELHRDLVSLNMIRNLDIQGRDVEFTIMLTTPACPLRGKMEGDCRAALAGVENIGSIKVNFDANVPENQRIAEQLGQKFKHAIAIASGKGGVGKSTVSVNLAIALAQTGASVGLLDADILGPNIPMMMGVDKMPPPQNRKLIPAEAHGVKFISMAFLSDPNKPMIWRGPMLHSAIRQLLTDVEWGDLDYLIIDLPPGTGDAQLSLAQTLPLSGAVIVTQPMMVAASDALRGLKTFETLNVPIIGVVENMSGEMFGTGAGSMLATNNQTEYLGTIPLAAAVREGGDTGNPIVVVEPQSAAAEAFSAVAQQVAARVSVMTLMDDSSFIPIEMIG
ncbi:MAG: Mrp/NBP35 family ATP-binding protein [Ardenticatenaceae bacterium]|nr:Mrp/NBP35 family ATP-binding protein [Ardenticatenaceae bacterium]